MTERAQHTKRRFLGRLASVFLLGWTFLLASSGGTSGCPASSAGGREADLSSHPRYKTRIKRKWGVEVIGIRRTAAGYILDFRYRVIDVEKARPVFERKNKPMLIHEATGAQFVVPAPGKVGPLRNSNIPQEGRIYWMAFANPAKFIQPGDRVTVVIGDFRAEHLVVE